MKKILLSILILSAIISCQDSETRKKALLPSSIGKIDEVILVMEMNDWDGPLGATFREYFGSDFQVVPQSEPVFELKHKTFEQFNNDFLSKFSTIIFAGGLDRKSQVSTLIKNSIGDDALLRFKNDNSFFYVTNHDEWAKGQLLIYLFSTTAEDLINHLQKSHQKISDLIYSAEHSRIKKLVYHSGRNKMLESILNDSMNLNMEIPADYRKAVINDSVFWLRKEITDLSSSIFICQKTISKSLIMNKASALTMRNHIVKQYVTSQIKGSYMQTDTSVFPVFQKEVVFDNYPAILTKGLWNMKNDFMGGPFINYLIFDQPNNRLIMIDGFVHAPKLKKKHLIRHLETLFKTLEMQGGY